MQTDFTKEQNHYVIKKGDQVQPISGSRKGIVKQVSDTNMCWVDCGDSSSFTQWYDMRVLHHTDDVTKRVRGYMQKPSDSTPTDIEPGSLSDIKEGDKVITTNGNVAKATKVSSRQVRISDNLKFVKSTGEGWGSQDIGAKPYEGEEEQNTSSPYDEELISEGDTIVLSNDTTHNVSTVSKRQVKTKSGKTFKRSNGHGGWSTDSSLYIETIK